MLLYKIINNMSAGKSNPQSKPAAIRELKKLDKEYNQAILRKERKKEGGSRSFK